MNSSGEAQDENKDGLSSDPYSIIRPQEYVPTTKAYDSKAFLHSRDARHIRIMCEYLDTQRRLRDQSVLFSVLFFGSARGSDRGTYDRTIADLEKKLNDDSEDHSAINEHLSRLRRTQWLCDYYEKGRQLAAKIATWAATDEARTALKEIEASMPSPVSADAARGSGPSTKKESTLVVCTGGGPGLMEGANRGAKDAGGRSMGMGITLPSEPGLNMYVDAPLAFQYHYFFTRKFWMVYLALGLVAMPGGLGTLDEIMEVLTLKQTGKVKRKIPVVLLGKEFWSRTVNFDYLVEVGTVSAKDVAEVLYTDDVEEAFQFIRSIVIKTDEFIVAEHKSKKKAHCQSSPEALTASPAN